MPGLSEIWECPTCARIGHESHYQAVAVQRMGNRPYRPNLPSIKQRAQIYSDGYRLLYQMGGSNSVKSRDISYHGRLREGPYRLPIRHSPDYYNRSGNNVHIRGIRGIHSRYGNQIVKLLSILRPS